MAGKSASEVFSSPEAQTLGVAAGATGLAPTLVPALKGAAGNPQNPFGEAALEDQRRAEEAFKKAQGLQTTVEQAGTNAVKGTTSQTSGTTFAPATKAEQELRDASIANFQKQQGLVNQFEQDITGRLGTQTAARGGLESILGGQAFELTPGEQERINALRSADIAASSNAVNELLDQRLAETQADAARRGIRGQAFTQLQGDAAREAARTLERATLEANRTAASNALALPGQRAGIQASTAGQFADFASAAQQQAIANRQQLQDPVALQQLLEERLRGGTTTSTQTTDQTTSTADKRVGTGEGAANILAAGVGLPGEKSAKIGGALEALGAGAKVIGAIA